MKITKMTLKKYRNYDNLEISFTSPGWISTFMII